MGAVATDDIDGSIKVIVPGSVDTNLFGVYEIHYNTTDSSNNLATKVIRTMNVAEAP